MWNRFVEILQEPASKRLGLAIVISAALHTLFFGNLHVFLPIVKQEMHLIEARIQMPKAVAEPTAGPIVETLPDEPVAEPKVEEAIIEEDKIEESRAEEIIEPVAPATEPALDSAPVTPTSVESAEQKPNPEPELAPPQPDDIGLVINENAYQYIETEFDVSTKIDGEAEGKAKITYNLIPNAVEGNQYQIDWLTEGSGILALLFPELLQTSIGELTKSGLRPNQYSYQFGKKSDKSRYASFDWRDKKVTLTTAKGTKTEELPEGTQDLLSFMYQFMHVAPLQHMQLPIVTGKKLRIYDYTFEGETQVNSPLGEIKTIHILHSGNDEDKTELWLAIDYQYVPVKIRKIDSDGKVVEMLATRITTNRPVINQ